MNNDANTSHTKPASTLSQIGETYLFTHTHKGRAARVIVEEVHSSLYPQETTLDILYNVYTVKGKRDYQGHAARSHNLFAFQHIISL